MSDDGRERLRSDSLTWTPTAAGEVIASHLVASWYLSANDSAAALWTRLTAGATQDELVEAPISTFGMSAKTAQAHVAEFVADLRVPGLLTEST